MAKNQSDSPLYNYTISEFHLFPSPSSFNRSYLTNCWFELPSPLIKLLCFRGKFNHKKASFLFPHCSIHSRVLSFLTIHTKPTVGEHFNVGDNQGSRILGMRLCFLLYSEPTSTYQRDSSI
jgi:hypothetical protein